MILIMGFMLMCSIAAMADEADEKRRRRRGTERSDIRLSAGNRYIFERAERRGR